MQFAIIAWVCAVPLFGQAQLGEIRGQVTDPSGRVVPRVQISLSRAQRVVQNAISGSDGRFEFREVVPGEYRIRAIVNGFAAFDLPAVGVAEGAVQTLNIALRLPVRDEQVTVRDVGRVDLNPDSNAGALVLRGKDLEALSDDRGDMAADLQALAGPTAGPNGGQIYIDGFTGGRLPPKASIREVRVNQNPFSAQFDRPGYGRIEIFTKPGAESFHGELVFVYGNDIFNSRNPFTAIKPPYERRQWEGEVTGPITKKTSFFADFEVRRLSENAFINALTLDDNLQTLLVSQGVVTPLESTEENFKLDHQLTRNHTLSTRYEFQRGTRDNQGIGGFSLASRAYQNVESESSLQASETGLFGAHVINEVRGRYHRVRTRLSGNAGLPAITVPEVFTGGGSPLTLSFTNQDRYEVQNLTSWLGGAHYIRWGARIRAVRLRDQDTQNYTGSYTFNTLDSYRLTLLGLRNHLTAAQIRASGGGASQFSIAAGNPLAEVTQVDAGIFLQDDWRMRPNLTLSFGLRYEAQTHLGDRRDFAPRIGVAWGLGKPGKTFKTVVRLGAGVFYDRFAESLTLDALRRDGIHQQQFLVQSPDFYPSIPSAADLAIGQLPQAIRRIDAGMNAPRLFQTAIGVERQLPRSVAVTTNYVRTRGLHQLRSRNINAPLFGGAVFPYGSATALYMYESGGRFQQDQWINTVSARVSPNFTLAGSYTLGNAMSDTDGANTFPSDPYNLQPEYGRAAFDIRHRVQMNGSIAAPWGLRFSPLLIATSGRPFNVTIGRDLNGDTLFADRPALTAGGLFNLAPMPGETVIPRNYGNGPVQFALNLRASKTIKIGAEAKAGKGNGRNPFEMTLSVAARNALNRANLALPVGNLSSVLFGQSTGLASGSGGGAAGNRRLDLQVKFSF